MKTFMNNDISPPDPSWDYYIHYHRLLAAKSKLQDLIEWLSEINLGTDEIDGSLDDDLVEIIKIIEDTRNYEVHTPDEPD
jgi:hypothetical protein